MTIPKSKAHNAYQLLNDVVALVREEPRRLYMPAWIVRGKYTLRQALGRRQPPRCGTVGCVAGWVVILHDGVKKAPVEDTRIEDRAEEILGLQPYLVGADWNQLVTGEVRDDTGTRILPGSRRYVDAVVDRIRRFQGKYEAVLRARVFPR